LSGHRHFRLEKSEEYGSYLNDLSLSLFGPFRNVLLGSLVEILLAFL